MRQFDFKKEYIKLLTPDIVAMLTAIHDFRGEQSLYIEADKDALAQLLEIARIQSTEASNRIEGIITTDERLKKDRPGKDHAQNQRRERNRRIP